MIEFVPIKSIDGGDDLKAIRLDRVAIAAAADGRPIATRTNLQGENHPEEQSESHPVRLGESRGENSERLYKTIETTKPLIQEPSSCWPPIPNPVVVGEASFYLFFGVRIEQLETLKQTAKRIRTLSKTTATTLSTAAIWIAAIYVASDWDAYGVAETIGSGTVNFPRKYLGTAVRNGATEYLEGVAGS